MNDSATLLLICVCRIGGRKHLHFNVMTYLQLVSREIFSRFHFTLASKVAHKKRKIKLLKHHYLSLQEAPNRPPVIHTWHRISHFSVFKDAMQIFSTQMSDFALHKMWTDLLKLIWVVLILFQCLVAPQKHLVYLSYFDEKHLLTKNCTPWLINNENLQCRRNILPRNNEEANGRLKLVHYWSNNNVCKIQQIIINSWFMHELDGESQKPICVVKTELQVSYKNSILWRMDEIVTLMAAWQMISYGWF